VTIDPDADLDRDGDVDGVDLGILAKSFGSNKNDQNYDPLCDFVYDWNVNGVDLKAFSPFLGKTNCSCFIQRRERIVNNSRADWKALFYDDFESGDLSKRTITIEPDSPTPAGREIMGESENNLFKCT